MCCTVSRFCCCCQLRVGAIIVTFFSALFVVYCVALTVLSFTSNEEKIYQLYKTQGTDDLDPKTRMWIQRAIFGTMAITGCVVTVCLCCALSNNSARCVIPWLIWEVIAIVGLILNTILYLIAKKWLEGGIGLAQIPFAIYIWVCMYSYMQELKGSLRITRGV
uniref:Uncharacterized protein n=1 Tax=Strigamia maritima TaxID=126957 RepID=T1JFW6_STRMM